MNRAQFSATYWLLTKFLLLPILPACLIACSTSTITLEPEPTKPTPEVTESVDVQPKIKNPSKRDVEIVEAKITDLLINRTFEGAEKIKESDFIERLRDSSFSQNGSPKYFSNLKKYRKQLAKMLKQGCIDDAYKRWNFSSNGSNYGIIERLESFRWFAGITAWKVKDRQYLISFTCGHGMSLRENAVFLFTEIASEPEVKPLRLVDVRRNEKTREFKFHPAWDTLVFGSFGPFFDLKTGELSIETKGNRSGQLRSSWKYKIENNDFVLVEFRDRDWNYKGSDIPRVYP